MMVEHETRGDVLIARPVGRLDSASSSDLERMLTEQLEAGVRRLIFDLSDMDYVSAAGMRVILSTGRQLRAQEGRLALAGLREMVRDVFEISGFLSLFDAASTVDDALARLESDL